MSELRAVTRQAGIRREEAVLLGCARTRLEAEDTQWLRALLQEDIDWSSLLELAKRHSIRPRLLHSLTAHFADSVPKAVMEELKRQTLMLAAHNLVLASELTRTLKQLEAAGVQAIPYKGPVLAETVYGKLSLREFVDLDILVQRKDVRRAKEILTGLGYRMHAQPGVSEVFYRQKMHHYPLVRADGKVLLELHWEITPAYFALSLPAERLWGHFGHGQVLGAQVLSLAAEDMLLLICVHASHHGWDRLSWVCDVAELLRAQAVMDWERTLHRARELGAERMLLLGLSLASDLLGAILPGEIRRRVQADAVLGSLALKVHERLFHEVVTPPQTSSRFRLFGFHLRVRTSLWDKVRFCVWIALTPSEEDCAFLPLPGMLYPLYYLVRPVRLVGKHGYRLGKRVLGEPEQREGVQKGVAGGVVSAKSGGSDGSWNGDGL